MTLAIRKFIPHLIVLAFFTVAAMVYFYPVMQGKEIYQSDIVQYRGMAKLQNDFRAESGEESYWTDAAFGGMPTYQLGAKYPHNYIKKLDLALRFLPRPADYLFLYFAGLYALLLVMKIDYKIAVLGALAFGFSTYLIIILGVGHNAKAHAIGYMPLFLAGVLWLLRKPGLPSFLLTTIAMGLELNANHFQMTYYLGILTAIILLFYALQALKDKRLPTFLKTVGLLVIAVVLALGLNATNLMATGEYTAFSTRGTSTLNINPDGTPKENTSGLDKSYITEYSYGIGETLNLLIPRLYGGSNSENLGKESALYDYLRKQGATNAQATSFAESAPTYWGNQPIVAAPAYLGVVVIFLLIVGFMLSKGALKKGFAAAMILSLLLSWGKNFPLLTDFFIDYIPLYDKFRAVSSIQVIVELCAPVMAAWGLYLFLQKEQNVSERKKSIIYALGISGGLSLLIILFKNSLFDFSGINDGYYASQLGPGFIDALETDRATLASADALRSFLLVLLTSGLLWGYFQEKINRQVVLIGIGLLVVFDLAGIAKRYVNADSFVDSKQLEQAFLPTEADKRILEDNRHFRVLDLTSSPFNSARASYFHKSIGGYHAAKPARMQDLYDFYISRNKLEILNMLNVKYIIQNSEEGNPIPGINPDANGAVWWVDEVRFSRDENEEILALDSVDTKTTAIVHKAFANMIDTTLLSKDSTDVIRIKTYQPNHLSYSYTSKSPRVAVFSEAYYNKGWQAYVDGNPQPHFRANYILRAMQLPAGKHTVDFKFEPEVIETGSQIALFSSLILGILTLGATFFYIKKKK
ncbi:MAG: YfhO family protein [Bacteroidetes bacterium]|nr:YfhO family protein [Bacteroidota bacterium]